MRGRASCFIRVLPALVVGASALMFAAPGASAAGGTATTFTLGGGSLNITQPASVDLGTAPVGSTVWSGSLGAVSVSDTRGALAATWTASVTSTNFITGTGANPSQTVLNSAIAYSSGTATSTGLGVFTPGVVASMSGSGTAGGWVGTAGTGGTNSSTWSPTVTFTLSTSQVSGMYTGTITHSVA